MIKIYLGILILITIIYILKKTKKEQILYGKGQIIGNRDEQQDSCEILKTENRILAVVADGMGGLFNGKLASETAINIFLEEYVKLYDLYEIDKYFINTSYIANEKILKISNENRMGTTLVASVVTPKKIYWMSIGDSNIYLFRKKQLIKLNEEHVYKNQLLNKYKNGKISRKEYFSNSKRERLTSYLGYKNFHEIDFNENGLDFLKGDKIILCTDGIHKFLTELELINLLNKNLNPHVLVKKILFEIENKNHIEQDNASIVIFEKR
jgi:serine/threonine protein phosphatase PrpC